MFSLTGLNTSYSILCSSSSPPSISQVFLLIQSLFCLSICPVCLSILSVYLSCLSICPVCLSILPVYLSCLSIYPVCLSILPVYLSCLSICPVCLCILSVRKSCLPLCLSLPYNYKALSISCSLLTSVQSLSHFVSLNVSLLQDFSFVI